MVLILRARGIELAATAVHSSPGMSVQPDIPIFIWRRLPRGMVAFRSCRGLTSACSFFVSDRGRTNCVSGSYTLCFPSSLACKGEMEVFDPNVPLLWYAHPWGCLFNQTSRFVFRRCLRRLQRRGGFFAHAEGQTSACSFPMSGRGCRVATTACSDTPSGASVQPNAPILFFFCHRFFLVYYVYDITLVSAPFHVTS